MVLDNKFIIIVDVELFPFSVNRVENGSVLSYHA